MSVIDLKDIYQPISGQIKEVERLIASALNKTRNETILEINHYLLASGGKRIRPALVILSAKAALGKESSELEDKLVKIASGLELIHIASLIHDDIIDKASLRHNRSTVNCKWGEGVAIALGDYVYSAAFELISQCGSTDIVNCISSAAKAMCEGELTQVKNRDDFESSKDQYLITVKNKTAALFAASCQAGGLLFSKDKVYVGALRDFGLNFGIAFQIIDDYLDIMGTEQDVGKTIGQDIKVGELTLPVIQLWENSSQKEKLELKDLLLSLSKESSNGKFLDKIREKIATSGAASKTKETVASFTSLAKDRIGVLPSSAYKRSLLNLADFIYQRGFNRG
jgi:octaprenyl-diphosphate synthase